MLITSRAVALLLAASVSLITVAFLSLVDSSTPRSLFVAGAISFCACFILSYFMLDFLIFKEVYKIRTGLDQLRGKSSDGDTAPVISNLTTAERPSSNPIRRINQEIVDFAYSKEEEIDKLKRLEAYRREFLADVSHELKTPIFAAQGYILTLLDGAVDDPKVKYKFLKKAAKSLNGLDAIVQDLITLSQIEAGVIQMKYEVFDLQMLTMDVFDQLDNKAEKRDIQLSIPTLTQGGCWVRADYNRINQVMINLVNNAIKYNRQGGWVKVLLEGDPDNPKRVRVSVTDNGLGIAPEHLARVFERFYRVDKSRSKKQGGSGLGLSIVKHILESHHSAIAAHSDLNEGTTFYFSLDKAETDEETKI